MSLEPLNTRGWSIYTYRDRKIACNRGGTMRLSKDRVKRGKK